MNWIIEKVPVKENILCNEEKAPFYNITEINPANVHKTFKETLQLCIREFSISGIRN